METDNPIRFAVPAPWRIKAAMAPVSLLMLLMLASCAQQPWLHEQAAEPEPVLAPESVVAEERNPTPEQENPTSEQENPTPEKEKPTPKKEKTSLWEWNGNDRQISHIEVDLKSQKAHFYDGDKPIGWTYVASGLKKYPTPIGQFAVTEKASEKQSNLYGNIYDAKGRLVKSNATPGRDRIPAGGRFEGARMPYFMRLTSDGIGLHAGRIPRPGSPASHGCIRMPNKVATLLFERVNLGTKVTITGNGPNYGDYVERQRRARAAEKALAAKKAAQATKTVAKAEPASQTKPATQADRKSVV